MAEREYLFVGYSVVMPIAIVVVLGDKSVLYNRGTLLMVFECVVTVSLGVRLVPCLS